MRVSSSSDAADRAARLLLARAVHDTLPRVQAADRCAALLNATAEDVVRARIDFYASLDALGCPPPRFVQRLLTADRALLAEADDRVGDSTPPDQQAPQVPSPEERAILRARGRFARERAARLRVTTEALRERAAELRTTSDQAVNDARALQLALEAIRELDRVRADLEALPGGEG